MAMTTAFRCSCGKVYEFYIPKKKLGEIMGITEDWDAIDAEEEKAGEIELARHGAAELGHEFIDGRETEDVTCWNCREVTSPLADIKARFN